MVRSRPQLSVNTLWIVFGAAGLLLAYAVAFLVLLLWLSMTGRMGGNSAEIIVTKPVFPTPNPASEPLIGQQPKEEALGREGVIRTQFVSEPFEIDANLAGWSDIETISSAYQVYTASSWDGTSDGAAFWRTAWDYDFLYISAIVVDDLHIQFKENVVYRGDTLEMQIDTDVGATTITPRSFTIVLSPGDFETLAPFVACLRGTSDGQMRAISQHSTRIAVAPTETGYAVEAAIPWGDLGVKPADQWMGRIALSLHDTDSAERIRAEVIQSSIIKRQIDAPNSWGVLLLTD